MNEGRYTENADGTLTLVRWPRTKEAAVIPAQVDGRAVTRIAPMAFAPFHMEEKDFVSGFRPPYSAEDIESRKEEIKPKIEETL